MFLKRTSLGHALQNQFYHHFGCRRAQVQGFFARQTEISTESKLLGLVDQADHASHGARRCPRPTLLSFAQFPTTAELIRSLAQFSADSRRAALPAWHRFEPAAESQASAGEAEYSAIRPA